MSLMDWWEDMKDAGENWLECARDTWEEKVEEWRDQVAESLEKIENRYIISVIPVPGSVVYCKLLTAHHSGIYLGDGRIAHLNGDGMIESVDAGEFINRLDGFNTAMQIYVACKDGVAVGCAKVAERASRMLGQRRNYNLILDNCHQFAAGCLTGDFENPINFFWMLKDTTKEVLGSEAWRPWDLPPESLFY